MYRIEKEFCFEAAHSLPHLPSGHKCARPHGHSYRVRVALSSPALNDDGFVLDYAKLAPIREFLDERWDHRNLNDLPRDLRPEVTSAECLAEWLYFHFKPFYPQLREVAVSETGKTWSCFLETA